MLNRLYEFHYDEECWLRLVSPATGGAVSGDVSPCWSEKALASALPSAWNTAAPDPQLDTPVAPLTQSMC